MNQYANDCIGTYKLSGFHLGFFFCVCVCVCVGGGGGGGGIVCESPHTKCWISCALGLASLVGIQEENWG